MMRKSIVAFAVVFSSATSAWAAPFLVNSTFNADFAASQSLWSGGPTAGLDRQGSTGGSVGAYYSVRADTGTVNARQNAGIVASYWTEQTAGTPVQIGLDFVGDAGGGFVEARFGAAAEAGVFLDISGCFGAVVFGACVGIPYNIDTSIPIIDEGFFLNPATTHTPVIDVSRTAQQADDAFGVGTLNTPLGNLGPSMNLDLDQRITFTPTGLTGTAFYRNLTTGAVGSTGFTIPTDSPLSLQLALGVGSWEISFLDLALQNLFRNDIDLELRPAFDYVVGSWPPAGNGLFSFGLIDETFALNFGLVSNLGTIRLDVLEAQAVPEPATLALMGVALTVYSVTRRRRNGRAVLWPR